MMIRRVETNHFSFRLDPERLLRDWKKRSERYWICSGRCHWDKKSKWLCRLKKLMGRRESLVVCLVMPHSVSKFNYWAFLDLYLNEKDTS